jgi:hypothetical protein
MLFVSVSQKQEMEEGSMSRWSVLGPRREPPKEMNLDLFDCHSIDLRGLVLFDKASTGLRKIKPTIQRSEII